MMLKDLRWERDPGDEYEYADLDMVPKEHWHNVYRPCMFKNDSGDYDLVGLKPKDRWSIDPLEAQALLNHYLEGNDAR